MKRFAYADAKIGGKEIMIAVPSMLIGGGMLTLPHAVVQGTIGSDGWILIAIGGLLTLLMAWLVTKLATNYPNQPFITYASTIITKPLAVGVTFLFGVIGLLLTSYIIRNIANTAKEYMFDKTPVEVIALTFLLVVVYGVASSRIGLFRLNMLFFPFIVTIIGLTLIFSVKWVDFGHFLPMFQTSPRQYIKEIDAVIPAYAGLIILLFYLTLVEKPKKAPKMVALGVGIPIVLYLAVFVVSIGVFGHVGLSELLNPTVELAKRAEVPGGIFERMETVFYVIWMMAIFNTAAMAFDITVLAFQSVFTKAQKTTIIFVLSPMVYLICMLPENFVQLEQFGKIISIFSITTTLAVTILLLIIAKIRGVKPVD